MSGSKKFGVVLSGCGVYDGAEIHESVLTLLAIDEAGHESVCIAPTGPQMHVINHETGEVAEGETRDIRVEAARIARGACLDLADARADDFDAIVFPGGFGAAKNLSDFAVKGADCAVHPEAARLVREMHAAGKPVGFACIAPAFAAKIYSEAGITTKLTVGSDEDGAAGAMRSMDGITHIDCPVEKAVTDADNKIVSTPAYMLAGRVTEVRDSTKSMVDEVLRLM